jgi:hypothetical protein
MAREQSSTDLHPAGGRFRVVDRLLDELPTLLPVDKKLVQKSSHRTEEREARSILLMASMPIVMPPIAYCAMLTVGWSKPNPCLPSL